MRRTRDSNTGRRQGTQGAVTDVQQGRAEEELVGLASGGLAPKSSSVNSSEVVV